MMPGHHELPFGAELTADGVRLRLWAPSAGIVSLQIAKANPVATPILRDPGGWFSLRTPLALPATRYRYVVDGRSFPDPASRDQSRGLHGASEVVDPEWEPWNAPERNFFLLPPAPQ